MHRDPKGRIRQSRTWERMASPAQVSVAAGAGSSAAIVSAATLDEYQKPTILRVKGFIFARIVAGAAGDINVIWTSMSYHDASMAPVTPIGQPQHKWMYYRQWAMTFDLVFQTYIPEQTVDVKSMRKATAQQMQLSIGFGNTGITGVKVVEFIYQFSTLIGS